MASPTERDSRDGVEVAGGLDRAAAILGAFDATHRELTLAALVAPLRAAALDDAPHRGPDAAARLAGQARRPLPDRQPALRALRPGPDPARAARGRAAVPAGPVQRRRASTVQLGVLDGTAGAGRREDHRAPADADAVAGRRDDPGALLGAGPGDPRLVATRRPWTRCIAAGLDRADPAHDHHAATRCAASSPRSPTGAGRVDREEGNIGVSCVAAPIFGPLGEVVAAAVGHRPVGRWCAPTGSGPAVRLAAAAASRAYSTPPLSDHGPAERDRALVSGRRGPDAVSPGTRPSPAAATPEETQMSWAAATCSPRARERQIPAIGLGITTKTDGESTRDAYSLFEYADPGRSQRAAAARAHPRGRVVHLPRRAARGDARRRDVRPGARRLPATCRATSCTPSATRSTTRRG